MPRDPRKLRAFVLADDLVLEIYSLTKGFPDDEKYGLVSQMRRAAVSIPANLAEGCGRRTTHDYLRFVNIATGSSYELEYLISLATRLGFLTKAVGDRLGDRCGHISASLIALVESLDNTE